ncbi:unnamed protein product [Arabidopsis halleri]
MKSSHIVLLCIVIFSIFALHECQRTNVGKIERSMLDIFKPPCHKSICELITKKECWCCFGPEARQNSCWAYPDYPNAKDLCSTECARSFKNL